MSTPGRIATQLRYRQKHRARMLEEYAADPLKQTKNIYRAMLQRCSDKNADNYERYGGRGISVCQRWRDSVDNFIQDVGVRPSSDHSIDRWPNTNGNYEPGNVRWATIDQQRANRREMKTELRLIFDGRVQTVAQWAKEIGINRAIIRDRIQRFNWTVRRTLTTPSQGRQQ